MSAITAEQDAPKQYASPRAWVVTLVAALWTLPYANYVVRFVPPESYWDSLSGPSYYAWIVLHLGLTVGLFAVAIGDARSRPPRAVSNAIISACLILLVSACAIVDDQWRLRIIGVAYRRLPMHQQADPISDLFFHWRSIWQVVIVLLGLISLHQALSRSPRTRPHLKEAYARIALMLAPFILAGLGLELGLRAGWIQEPWAAPDGGTAIYRLNLLTGWGHRSGVMSSLIAPEYRVKVQINRDGLRNEELPHERVPGRGRIMCLGDSFTFGVGVEAEQTFSKILQNRLLRDTDVINTGVTGFGTDQEYLYLTYEGKRYQPDLVVLVFYSENDMDDNQRHSGLGYPKPYFVMGPNGLELKTFVDSSKLQYGADPEPFSFRRWSRAYEHIRRWIYMIQEARKLKATLASAPTTPTGAPAASSTNRLAADPAACLDEPRFAQPPSGYEVTRALFLATSDECRRIGAKFLVLLIPPRELVKEAPNPTSELAVRSARAYRAMRDVCRSQRLLYVDTLGELSRRQHSGQTLFFTHDPHPTPQGHIAVAEMLARTISEDNLMPAKYVLDARNLNATPSPPDGSSVTR